MVILSFVPILLFILLYGGSGIYFSWLGMPNAFYQISPTVAIIPAIAVAWLCQRGTTAQRMHRFLEGVRHPDIITMCLIFLLAGAFSAVTQTIGSVEATVNFALSLISAHFLLIGIFITAAFISLAIGTSMGTIATVAPIAMGLAQQGAFAPVIGMATVVGGAMFGDNLSLISDTTIAAVMSQEAAMKAKLRVNALVAGVASIITIAVLWWVHDGTVVVEAASYSLLLVAPYFFLILLAICGINVFVVLVASLLLAGAIGYVHHGYSFLAFNHDIVRGFASMHEIMVLSLLVGGLSGLAAKESDAITAGLAAWIAKCKGGRRLAQLMIAAIVAIADLLFANNTVAIIFSGKTARAIAQRYAIPPHYSAAWLDIFSCVMQGLIPYGAQVLLASTIAGVSPLSITPHVYYCYILGAVSVGYIVLFNKQGR
jgi:Na+/H+ antiporter NhaC